MTMRKTIEIEIESIENGLALKAVLSKEVGLSRREISRLKFAHGLFINGQEARVTQPVYTGDQVTLIFPEKDTPHALRLLQKPDILYEDDDIVIVNKPAGMVCHPSHEHLDDDMGTLLQNYYGEDFTIRAVGRLDKDSEGLILMTNQEDIVNKMMRSGNAHEKEYVVKVDQEITPEFLKKMAQGVPILDTVTRPCEIFQTGKKSFRIILTQGLNRQIRRMCEYLGYRVVRLKRIRVMNIQLGDLPVGSYREVTREEKKVLFSMIRNSSNTTVRYKGDKHAK